MKIVPVLSKDNKPLMPTSPSKARKLIKDKKATPFWKLNTFCIRLNYQTETIEIQPVIVAIDPGSKKEGYTVRSKAHHYLNIQCDAITWVKDRMEARRNMRRTRRNRKTPCRPPRFLNRGSNIDWSPPSTKARHQLKLNITKKLMTMFPISIVKIEPISAMSKEGKRKWNTSFSPLQIGKKWFEKEIRKLGVEYKTIEGTETAKLRKHYKLSKTKKKLSEGFDAHIVDTAVVSANELGSKIADENRKILFLTPNQCDRRQLHKFQKAADQKERTRVGGIRNIPIGFTKGSIIKLLKPNKTTLKSNPKSIFMVGGFDSENKMTIVSLDDQSNRVSRSIKPSDVKLLSYNRYIFR